MTLCDQIVASHLERRPLAPALLRHAATCPACRAAASLDALLEPRDGVTLAPSAELRAALAAPLAPVQQLSTAALVAPVLLGTATMVGLSLALRPRDDLHEQWPHGMAARGAFLLGSLAIGVGLSAAGGPHGLGLTPRARLAYACAAGALFPLVAAVTSEPTAHSHPLAGLTLWSGYLTCATSGALFAAIVGALLVRLVRRNAVVAPESAGFAAGVAAGCAGALVLMMKCSIADPAHVARAHWAPVLVCAVAGRALGARLLAW